MDNLIRKFYIAFSHLDYETMADCYHPDIQFEDPAFGKLNSEEVRAMWTMLCKSQKDKNFILAYHDIHLSENHGSAIWEAEYTFSKTGRRVHNVINANFDFRDGKIINHKDEFSLYNWSIQAFGMTGLLIGWTGYFKKKLNSQSRKMLDKYMSSEEHNQT